MQTQTNIRLEVSLLNWLKKQAENDNRSLNGYIVEILTKEQDKVSLTPKIQDIDERLKCLEESMVRFKKQNLLDSILSKNNILIVGGTRSGKSFLLNRIREILEQLKFGYEDIALEENDSPINHLSLNGAATQAIIIDDKVSSAIFSDKKLTNDFLLFLNEKNKENIPVYMAIYPQYINEELNTFFNHQFVITSPNNPLTELENKSIHFNILTLNDIVSM